jgi:hypothetical protein
MVAMRLKIISLSMCMCAYAVCPGDPSLPGDKYLKKVYDYLVASGADASESNLNVAGKPPVLKEDKTKGCTVM